MIEDAEDAQNEGFSLAAPASTQNIDARPFSSMSAADVALHQDTPAQPVAVDDALRDTRATGSHASDPSNRFVANLACMSAAAAWPLGCAWCFHLRRATSVSL